MSKTKYIALSSYASEGDIARILSEKSEQIEHAFYCFHDKDESEPHTHIVLGLVASRNPSEIANWFKKCVNDEGRVQRTTAQAVISCRGIGDYLTHSGEGSGQQEKHQYTDEDIKVSKGCLADFKKLKTEAEIAAEAAEKREAKADESEQLLQDIIDKVPAREMARRYGRDYMKNHKSYREYAALVVLEETGDLPRADEIGSGGFQYINEVCRREAYEDGVISALNRVYEMVADEENGFSRTTKEDFKRILRCMSNRKEK